MTALTIYVEADSESLEEVLRASDEQTRPGRIQRIVWLSDHEQLPSAIMGRAETMQLLREAREVFIDGHFAASLLLAISVINHSLIEELQHRRTIQRDTGLSDVLHNSEKLRLLPKEWFAPLRQLIDRRHPFVHYKKSDHEHSLGARIALENTHPALLLEQDAHEAIVYMYRVFRATLREDS